MAQELPNTNDIIDPENRVNQWLKEYKETDSDATKRHLRELIVLAYMPLVKRLPVRLQGALPTLLKT